MEVKRIVVGPLDTNCYLIEDSGEFALIDPGGSADKIIETVKQRGTNLKYIFLTHAHPDHVQALEEVRVSLGGEVVVHEFEFEQVDYDDKRQVKEGDTFMIGQYRLTVIHTPGHTLGSYCLLGKNEAFTGDTLFQDGYGRTDLPGGDALVMYKSLKRLKGMLKPGMMVYPGHGEVYKA